MAIPIEAYERLLQTMRGIASCATRCDCCRMHARVADEAVRDAQLLLDPGRSPDQHELFPREHACKGT